jgi:ATP/maltotriose-dependent transcriptional regulator MalT
MTSPLDSETLGAWLQQAAKTRFLVTSRTRLGLEGEQVYYLAYLQRDQGQLETAAQTIAEAERNGVGLGDPLMTGQARAISGVIQQAQGDRFHALQSLEDARKVAQVMGVLPHSDLGRRIAELEAALGEGTTDL